MGQLLLFIVVALVVAAIVFGVTVMVGGGDPGLTPVEPDGRALPLPSDRPLGEEDIIRTRFDTALRGYRMSQVDQALQRAAYDIGYKGELIGVLEAEVTALREGRIADADVLRRAREAALAPPPAEAPAEPARGSEDPIEIVADVPPEEPVPAPNERVTPADGEPVERHERSGEATAPTTTANDRRAAERGREQRSGEATAPTTTANDRRAAERGRQQRSGETTSLTTTANDRRAAERGPH